VIATSFDAGTDHDTLIEEEPLVAVTPVGAPGAATDALGEAEDTAVGEVVAGVVVGAEVAGAVVGAEDSFR
jgi:hypothetical protein